jgi:hypothetical protein
VETLMPAKIPANKSPSKPTPRAWKYRTSLRLPGRAAVIADRIKAQLGIGDRADVIRAACMFGLEAFERDLGKIKRVNVEEE